MARDRVAALLELERENTALRVEVERLRLTVAALRASVPPTHPSDYGHEAWSAALEAAKAENENADDARRERAAVVAWLRRVTTDARDLYHAIADHIERGEHRRKEEP